MGKILRNTNIQEATRRRFPKVTERKLHSNVQNQETAKERDSESEILSLFWKNKMSNSLYSATFLKRPQMDNEYSYCLIFT